MSQSIAALHAMTDDEVIQQHDAVALHTAVGTAYWMDELERRSRERSTAASNRLARNSFWLSIISTVIAMIALVVSLVHG